VRAFFVYGNAKEESLLKSQRNPFLGAVTAVLLVIAILLCTGVPVDLLEPTGPRITAIRHGSGEAPYLPQRHLPKTLTAQLRIRANSSAVKSAGIFSESSYCGTVDEIVAPLTARHDESVRLLYLLRSTSPDRAPPHHI